MDKIKENIFWAFIVLLLFVVALAYLIVPVSNARKNREAMNQLEQQASTLRSLMNDQNTANQDMIAASRNHAQQLERDYARMVLFMIGRDSLLDRYHPGFGQTPRTFSPQRRYNVDRPTIHILSGDIVRSRTELTNEALSAGVILHRDAAPWTLVDLSGATPTIDRLMLAHKQLWIQRELLDIMKQEFNDKPAVTSLNRVEFPQAQIQRNEQLDARFSRLNFSIDVSLPPKNIPIVIERVMRSRLPITVNGYTITKGMSERMTGRAATAQAQTTEARVVTMKMDCSVIDFNMGLDKVVFSTEIFSDPEEVSKWLEQQTDPTLKILAEQLSQPDVRPQDDPVNGSIEYVIYGHRLIDMARECEIDRGVTIHYGTILPSGR